MIYTLLSSKRVIPQLGGETKLTLASISFVSTVVSLLLITTLVANTNFKIVNFASGQTTTTTSAPSSTTTTTGTTTTTSSSLLSSTSTTNAPTSTTSAPPASNSLVIFSGAPFPVANANISLTRCEFLSTDQYSGSSPSAGATIPKNTKFLVMALQIQPGTSDRLQWNRAVAQFAKFLTLTSPVVADSVFAPSRLIVDAAPWSVLVGGVNDSELSITIHVAACVDMPRRSTNERSFEIDFSIPPSMTSPPLTSRLMLPQIITFPQLESDSSLVQAREIVGAVFFVVCFVVVLLTSRNAGGGSAAIELLWTLQIMLAATDSPCAKHSFFSFSRHVFWILRWGVEPRSFVPAVVHVVVLLLGMIVSHFIGHKAAAPQRRLLHPKMGLVFLGLLLLGAVHSSASLLFGGIPDTALISADAGNRVVGIILLLITVVSAIAFCWTGTGLFSMMSMTIRPASTSSFYIQNVWRPITSWKRNSPITGVYANIAYLPPKLNFLSNFLPFLLSLLVNVVTAILLALDTNNIGGCIAIIATCLFISAMYGVYVAAGHRVCRTTAWAVFVSGLHAARVLWFCAVLAHLDCSGDVTSINNAATVLAILALIVVLFSAVLGFLASKKEQDHILSNKSKNKISSDDGFASSSSPARALLGEFNNNTNNNKEIPKISISQPGDRYSGSQQQQQIGQTPDKTMNYSNNNNNNKLSKLNLEGLSPIMTGNNLSPGTKSPMSASSSPTNGDPKKSKPRKNLPPHSEGTGEKPQSPLFGGLRRSAPFDPNNGQNHFGGSGGMSGGTIIPAGTGHNGGKDNNFGALSLRDRFLNLSDDINVNNNGSNSNGNTMVNLIDARRPRGESVESRLSSGSGGHSGPASTRERSPSNSFGRSAPPSFCPRCGVPTRNGPAGMRQLCSSCKVVIANSANNNSTDQWEIPDGNNFNNNNFSSSASSSVRPLLFASGSLNNNNNNNNNVFGGGESQEMRLMGGSNKNNNNHHHSNGIVLPSWQASEGGEATKGIVHLPSYQVQQSKNNNNNNNNRNKEQQDDDDNDWL